MVTVKWKPFPHNNEDYGYEGAALKRAWPELHRGDCEPFPDAAFVKEAFVRHPRLKGSLDADKTASALQSAWRAYHRGDFAAAVAEGTALGPIGANAANKAANIYATYLESDSERKREIFLKSAERAEALQAAAPDFVNAFYLHAQALGRYSQEISVVKALAQGIGGKVKASLDKAIKLEPNHADAHIALGAYHAEVVSTVGGMLASLTYGASKEEAVRHFALARKLLPDSAIARIEEANGLVMLFGKARLAEAEKLYAEAAKCAPADAMQKLDAEHAREEAEG
jgi:tetratricopeptide (TPR) repeat protein